MGYEIRQRKNAKGVVLEERICKCLTSINGIDSAALAKAFCEGMRKELTPAQMALVHERNLDEPSDGICHTHDFCDANVVMADAMESLGLEVLFPSDEPDEKLMQQQCDLWNEAWSLAKQCDFDANMVDEKVIDIQQNGI